MNESPAAVNFYARLHPDELERSIEACPAAFVPWGALEWHSAHLPLGLDGLIAREAAIRAARRVGGVVLPTFYLPITALPHRFSISVRSAAVRAVLDDLLDELARAGFRVVALLTGHYAQGHELALIEAAEAAFERSGLLALAAPPMALVDDAMLDHAGRWETSALLAIHPELVDMSKLERRLEAAPGRRPVDIGILGQLPAGLAAAADGEAALTAAADAVARLVRTLLATGSFEPLRDYYARRRAAYRAFLDRYFTVSWEEAAARWWIDINASYDAGRSA